MTCSPASSFCDWLDVTFAPDNWPYPELNLLFLGAGFVVRREITGAQPTFLRVVLVPSNSSRRRSTLRSLSGSPAVALRDLGLWGEVLSILSSSPHKVTRLDAAIDLPTDAAPFIAHLRRKYPAGMVNLGRKALPVKVMLEVRPDGLESGTYYIGHRTSARRTCRVYDKALEMLAKRGCQLPYYSGGSHRQKDAGATLRMHTCRMRCSGTLRPRPSSKLLRAFLCGFQTLRWGFLPFLPFRSCGRPSAPH